MASTSGGSSGNEMEWMLSRSARMKRAIRKRHERARSWSDESELGAEGSKRTKINQRVSSREQDNSNTEVEYKVVVEFQQERGYIHPIKITKAIEEEIGKIKTARIMNNRKVIIQAISEAQQQKIIKMKTLMGERVKSHIPGFMARLRGVISGVPLEMTMEEVKNEIKGGKITNATRIKSRREGELKDTMAVILQFENNMPENIQLGFMNYKVREYIPKPLRCFTCQRMGHIAKDCKGKIRCARCGGPHEFGKCDKDAKIKCCNCGGEHSAAYGGCIVQREAREAQKIKITERVSYAEALKRIKKDSKRGMRLGEADQSYTSQNTNQGMNGQRQILMPTTNTNNTCLHKCKIEENTMMVKKENFVAFICHVINVTVQMKKKSDKIKEIVTAAGRFLDMKEIQADQIHTILSATEITENGQD